MADLPLSYPTAPLEAALAAERARLVRLCASLTHTSDAAEDLAQESLLEAWRQRHKLVDPHGLWPWLAAVARNVCFRWRRRHGQESMLRATDAATAHGDIAEHARAAFDVERDLERHELADLLDRALAQLPPATRAVLIQRYIEDQPQAVIARQLGTSEGAVEARLQRGKLALRHVLVTELRDEAAAYGVLPADASWHTTRIWCTLCGRQRLRGRFADDGALWLQCPTCNATPGSMYHQGGSAAFFAGITGFKPALNRVFGALYATHHTAGAREQTTCPRCNQRLSWYLERQAPTALLRHYLEAMCRRCGERTTHTTWSATTLGLPEALRFWRDHQRIRPLPERCIEVAGTAAIVNGFESLTAPSQLEIVALRDRGTIVGVYRS